jgi:ketosteroid isomerase-like protein
MSQENVDLIHQSFDRFHAGDPDWATDFVHPEIEWDFSAYSLADLPDRGSGRESMLSEILATYYSGWLDLRQEIVETVDCGDDIVVILHETARMRGSEAVVEREVAHVWTVRARKWVRWRIFPDRDAALDAVDAGG